MTLLAGGWPSLSSHLSERRRRVILWTGLAAVTGWVHLAQFSSTLMWDSHIFMVVAQQVRRGLLPYRDLWELKPPGIFYYLSAVFTVLPEALWSVRLTDWLLYVLAAACFYRICRAETEPPFAFFGTAVWLYFSHHPSFDVGGVYTENYAAVCAVMAVAAAVEYAQGGALRMAFFSGVAVACAALFKHPGIAAFAPAVIVMARRPRFSAALLLWIGVIAPIALTVSYFWALGALDDFLACNVWALQTHGGLVHGVTEELVTARVWQLWEQSLRLLSPYPLLLGALVIGAPVCLLRPSFLRWGALIWAAIDFVGVAAQRNYYEHHYILTFPSTCLLGTLGLSWLLQPRPNEHRLLTLPRIALTIGLLVWALPSARVAYAERQEVVRQEWSVLLSGPGAWQRSPGRKFEEEVGAFVRERTQPQDRIHLQGWGATALAIYWEAERRVSTRFFYEAPFPIDTQRELAELQANRPEYVVVVSEPPFLFMSPWLASEYSLEAVKWHDYPARIFARTKERPFTDGRPVGVTPAPHVAGLTLSDTQVPQDSLQILPEPRRGVWTAPSLRIMSDDGTLTVDWNPRDDLAFNVDGHGLATVEALSRDPANEAKVLLGQATQRKRWSAWWRQETIPITVRFGFAAVIDHLTLQVANPAEMEDACDPPAISASTTANDPGSFVTIEGTWRIEEKGSRTFRFAPRLADGIRILGSPTACDFSYGLTRIRVGASGMGIRVRYRTGLTPDLEAAPWRDVDDDATQLKIPGVRFVQMQYELWSNYAEAAPVLHHAHVGRVRFTTDAAAMAATSD